MSITNKITHGYVIQTFDNSKLVKQEFAAGDECTYEDSEGEELRMDDERCEDYAPFDMVQPLDDEIVTVIEMQNGIISDIQSFVSLKDAETHIHSLLKNEEYDMNDVLQRGYTNDNGYDIEVKCHTINR